MLCIVDFENEEHRKVKVSSLQAMKALGDVDARIHIYTATALGRGKVTSPTLGRLYPRGEHPLVILWEALWTTETVRTRRNEKNKSSPLLHSGSNPGHPVRSDAPCHLS